MNASLWTRSAAALLAAGALACGTAETGPEEDPHAPFGAYTQSTVFTYTGDVPLGSKGRIVAGAVRTDVIGGRKIPMVHAVMDATGVEDLSNPALPAIDLWLDHEGNSMVVGGAAFPGLVTAKVDPPVVVPLGMPVGKPQTLTFNGSATLAGQATAQPVTLTAETTLVETGATVTGPMGSVPGCSHYAADWSLSGAGVPATVGKGPYKADVWYHPTWGLLKANLPELGLSIGLAAEEDYAGDGPGAVAIKRAGIVDDANPNWSISTYDRMRKLDADKLTHAKMLVELRWADETAAAAGAPAEGVDANVEFDGGFGYFPSMMVKATASYFYPDEKGFQYAYGYVSQALKNEGGTRGSMYSINVNQKAAGGKPIRVTGRIAYKVLTDAQMAEPMPEFK